jgi:DNA-binding PadR family transcriptional regulator
MPDALTPAELMLLGLLAEHPRHGYEIEKTIEERGIREWTDLAFSSIYYLLRKLERARLIHAVNDGSAGAGPRRKTYAPTAHGLAAARKAAQEALGDVTPAHPPVLVGLANYPLLPHQEAIDALHGRAEQLDKQLSRLANHPRGQMPAPAFVSAIFAHGLLALRAELDWTHQTLEILENDDAKD